jgi:hypothetical protein
LHDLNNAFSGVLMNAQVMECKLPSYSRSKRYIHEIERSAQRGSALVKRLMGHLVSQSKSGNDQALCVSLPPEVDNATAVANQEPPADRGTSYAS